MKPANLTRYQAFRKDNKLYIKPHQCLAPYIAHYTFTYPAGDKLPEQLTLIPDISGCFVITFTGNALECNFLGPSTKLMTVQNQPQSVPLMVFIEFMPGGASRLLHLNQAEFKDQLLSVEEISNRMMGDLTDTIYRFIDQPDYPRLIAASLDALFLSCLDKNQPDSIIAGLMTFLHQNRRIVSVRELSSACLYSERHFNRLITPVFGTNAKSFLRLLRINQAVKLLKSGHLPLADLAQYTGYYDQSHFNHDFKSICRVTPGEYRDKISVYYNEDFKF